MSIENPNRRWYSSDATQAKFLLGGIGTGNVSVGSRGQLCDWELWNSPQKGGQLSFTFFALRVQQQDETPQLRILESRLQVPHERAQGYAAWESGGVPRFARARLAGEVSRALVQLRDDAIPVEVDLDAFSPFVPLDEDSSGIPGAVLSYTVRNTSDAQLRVSLAGSIANPVGFAGYGLFGALKTEGEPHNAFRQESDVCGLYMTNPALPEGHLTGGSMALLLQDTENVTCKPCWNRSSWWNGAHDFWNDFARDGRLQSADPEGDYVPYPHFDAARLCVGSLCVELTLEPGEERTVKFAIAWHFPLRPARWPGHVFRDADDGRTVRNHYATQWPDAWAVARRLLKDEVLERQSDDFARALYRTTLPPVMLEAMAANITVLRSTTCFRIEGGEFLCWEGCFDNAGCCEGNCNHVWNYEQTLGYLFPALARRMRRVNFLGETNAEGAMAYRSNTVFGRSRFSALPPAADGQLGTIVQLYREWRLSGDDVFLREVWPGAVRALEYAITRWDTDGDNVLDAEQYNTYDIAFFGESSLTNVIFYAALRAAAAMAAHLGEDENALRWGKIADEGGRHMDEKLYNGEYYQQGLPTDAPTMYQYGSGCLADQIFGQQLASLAGLGDVLPKDHVHSALRSIYQYNFHPHLDEHLNVQRTYALNDEAGLVLCSWPRGGRPDIPFIYSDEVWSGIEYQVASHMICVGMWDEALSIVQGVRNRYDGVKRNPWNEVECGNHYARSLASWGLLLAASGFGCDLSKGTVFFAPQTPESDFSCFFSTGKCWGVYHQTKNENTGEVKREIEVLFGEKDAVRLG